MLTSTPEFKAVLRMLHDSGFEVTPDWLAWHMRFYLKNKRKIVLERMLDRGSPTHNSLIYTIAKVSAAELESE